MLRKTDSVITVSQKLAERYDKYNPIVLLNCPEKQNMPNHNRAATRKEFNVPEDAFILVYQGILSDTPQYFLGIQALEVSQNESETASENSKSILPAISADFASFELSPKPTNDFAKTLVFNSCSNC